MDEENILNEAQKVIIAKETIEKLLSYISDLLVYFDNPSKRKKLIGEVYLEIKEFNKKIKGLNKDFEDIIKSIKGCVYKVYSGKKESNREFFYDIKILLDKMNKNVTQCKKHYLRKLLNNIYKYGDTSL